MPVSRRSAAKRACDSCRRRKVKCDGSQRCSNCRTSQLSCQYTSFPKKRGPKQMRHAEDRSSSTNGSDELPSVSCADALSAEVLSWPCQSNVPDHEPAPSPSSGEEDEAPIEPSPSSSRGALLLATYDTVAVAAVDLLVTNSRAQAIRVELLVSLASAMPSSNIFAAIDHCIELYVRYIFPTAPYVHEPSLRATATKYFHDCQATDLFIADSWREAVNRMRAFSQLTALCAAVASIVPDSLLPHRSCLVDPCLLASRKMLAIFDDYDIEHPDSSSITIRMMHATALQQNSGKSGLSYHVLGQAALLAKNMSLHREESLEGCDMQEAQLRRNAFWQLYAADQASACFLSRAYVFHELLFDSPVSARLAEESFHPLLEPTKSGREGYFERQLLAGCGLFNRLWSSAASLLFDLRATGPASQTPGRKDRLLVAYMEFSDILDRLPPCLQTPYLISNHDEEDVAQFPKSAFWVQRCSILVTFHCLRLIVLQQCIKSGLCDIMGLNDETLNIGMTKISIAYDFIQTLRDIPFIYLQVKGEPMVERIRRVGSMLLEMSCTIDNESLRARAKKYFAQLLDILARLDSKASDEMSKRVTLECQPQRNAYASH